MSIFKKHNTNADRSAVKKMKFLSFHSTTQGKQASKKIILLSDLVSWLHLSSSSLNAFFCL